MKIYVHCIVGIFGMAKIRRVYIVQYTLERPFNRWWFIIIGENRDAKQRQREIFAIVLFAGSMSDVWNAVLLLFPHFSLLKKENIAVDEETMNV